MFNTCNGVYTFSRSKENKTCSIFDMQPFKEGSFLTSKVKIEDFQNYSHGNGFKEYFRTYGTTWKDGEQVTGLFPTNTPNVFYGNRKYKGVRTLLLLKLNDSRTILTVYVFNTGYYPHKDVIEQYAKSI